MFEWLSRRLRFRVTQSSKFPKGDVVSFFQNVRRRGFMPHSVIDVGANCGKWSRKALRVFPEAEFLLVEPQIEMESHLEKLCRRYPQAQWINAGVGDSQGVLNLTVIPDTVSSSFALSTAEATSQGYEQRPVPVLTLNQLATERMGMIPDMVKIDAEGFEARIMKGAEKLLGKTELFLLEAPLIDPPNHEWHSFLQLVSMMADFGYDVYDFTSFHRRPYDGAVGLCEIAFARRGGTLRKYTGWSKQAEKPVNSRAA